MDDIEESEEDEKRRTCHRLCVRFADKTSMQGVPYINTSKMWYAKLAWVFLLLVAIGVMTFHLYYLCFQFFTWPKITKVSLGFSNLKFPAVTFCNINPIRQSQLHEANVPLQTLVERVNPENLNLTLYKKRRKRFVDDFETFNVSEFDDDVDYSDYYDDEDEFIGEDDEVRLIEDRFLDLFMDHSREERQSLGHSIYDMLIKCTFDGKECSADNFTIFNTPDYGNCYTIQSDKFISKNPGPKSGLQLIFYMENDEYLSGITQGHGARITINSKNEIPYPIADGLSVTTHKDTDIALKLISIERIGWPHGTCEDGQSFFRTYKKQYTRAACAAFFRTSMHIKECNCYDEFEADLLFDTSIKSKPCSTREEEKCLARIDRQLDEKKLKPTCDNPCKEKQYVKTLSSIDWPSTEYSAILKKSVCEMIENCDSLRALSADDFSNNLIKINIYFEDLNFEEIIETPEIEVAQFLSDVGGAIGLWIGLSMLSMFELVQLLVELCQLATYKCSGNEKSRERDNKNVSKSRDMKNNESRDSTYDQPSKGFHKQNFNDESSSFPRPYTANGIPQWKRNSRIGSERDGSGSYPPETRYSDLNDYQHMGEYYIYKGQQNKF